jgi:tetratricopeptide (TPR) repeat protein
MVGEHVNFFVSHAGTDQAWAKWVAWQLIEAGYTVELDVWDWGAGQNFVTAMSDALARCDRVLALVSSAYFERSRHTTMEWSAAMALDAREGRLVPVRVEDVPVEMMPALLRPLIFFDLFGMDAEQARQVLLTAVAGPQRPDGEPVFPGRAEPGSLGPAPRFPGGMPRMVNAPPRNWAFTGREEVLAELGRRLEARPVAVVAVRGLGGVGKSQVALEYTYRMCGSGRYELAGWVRADSAVTVAEDLAKMAPLLGIDADRPPGELAAAVVTALGSRRDWLVVFDNAQTPDDLGDMLPRGGHILITSRNRVWGAIATQVDLGEFSRTESVTFVSERSGSHEPEAAGELAEELGDLPLALAQAAAFIDTLSMTIRGYLDLYREPAPGRRLRDAGLNSAEYPASVAGTWLMSFRQLSDERPAAVDLLRLCAFLDPDDIDLDLLSTGRGEADNVLAAVFDDQERTETVGALAVRSLVIVPAQGHLQVHRLVQAVTRDQLDDDQSAVWAERALGLVAAILPPEPGDYRTWSVYAKLAPHIEAVTGHATSPPSLTRKIDLLRKLGNYLSESEQLRAARITVERLLKIQEEAYGPDDPQVAMTLDNLGAIRLKLGELGEARALIERALAVLEGTYGPDDLEVAKTRGNLGIIQLDLWELGDARANLERALAVFQREYGPDHRDLTHTFVNLGVVQLRLGELEDARASFGRALASSDSADSADHPQAARALIGLGDVQMRQGDLENARASLEHALAISETVYGTGNPEVATALISLGDVQTRQGELGDARASLQRALGALQGAYGPDHPEVASALVYLGAVQLELGELGDARTSIERALVIRQTVYGPGHPWVASALINLGVAQLRLGELEDACTTLQRALAISEAVYGPANPEIASALVHLGVAQLRLGDLENSCASLQRAQAVLQEAYGPGSPAVAKGLVTWWVSRCG